MASWTTRPPWLWTVRPCRTLTRAQRPLPWIPGLREQTPVAKMFRSSILLGTKPTSPMIFSFASVLWQSRRRQESARLLLRKYSSMAQRDTERLQIFVSQVAQRTQINVVFGKNAGVCAETQSLQPLCDRLSHLPRRYHQSLARNPSGRTLRMIFVRAKRPGHRRAAQQCDELAPVHVGHLPPT
jgi:hypothetical protein